MVWVLFFGFVQWISWVVGGFLVDSGGGLVHGGSGSVAGWLVVGLWDGLLRWWWVCGVAC